MMIMISTDTSWVVAERGDEMSLKSIGSSPQVQLEEEEVKEEEKEDFYY